MYSRAHLLIEKDWEKFKVDKPWGVDAYPLTDENIFEWTAKINGLKRTLWEGGIFRIFIKFDENYTLRPPMVSFHTIPFHPNVDMITGRPCIDFLDNYEQWSPAFTIGYILLTIQTLLSNPVLDNAVNVEAVDMILNNPHAYKQMVLDCVAASQRVEAGLTPHVETAEQKVRFVPTPDQLHIETPKPERPPPARVEKTSFEDYHSTWRGIATSKYTNNEQNALLDSMKGNPSLQKIHCGLPFEEIQDQMSKQMEDHHNLMYGNFKSPKKTSKEDKASKIAKINHMKRIYLPQRRNVTPLVAPEPTPRPAGGLQDEPWEPEVNDLVAWTANLNADAL